MRLISVDLFITEVGKKSFRIDCLYPMIVFQGIEKLLGFCED